MSRETLDEGMLIPVATHIIADVVIGYFLLPHRPSALARRKRMLCRYRRLWAYYAA